MKAAGCAYQTDVLAPATPNGIPTISDGEQTDAARDRYAFVQPPAASVGALLESTRDPFAHVMLWIERIFLPTVLFGMGQIFYLIWFGAIATNFWWQLAGTFLLFVGFAAVTIWFVGSCLFPDP